jgi:hypothetical protein
MRGRKRAFCSGVPKWQITGPTSLRPRIDSGGAPASAHSFSKMNLCIGVQPVPPSSLGQCGATQPLR